MILIISTRFNIILQFMIILFYNISFVQSSSYNLNYMQINMKCSDTLYKKITECDLNNEYKAIITKFEPVIKKNFKLNDLSGKHIVFNRRNKWGVEVENMGTPDIFIKLEFHLNSEKCILSLNCDDFKKFLYEDLFGNFIVPSDVLINLKDKERNQLNVNFLPLESSKNLYRYNSGYKRNIIHIFEFIRGLFIISLKTNAYHVIDNFESSFIIRNKNDLPQEYRNITDKLINLDIKEKDFSKFNYVIRASQYLMSRIYYHHFNYFIRKGIISLSENLNQIFSIFNEDIQRDTYEIIKSKFLNVKIDKKILHETAQILADVAFSADKLYFAKFNSNLECYKIIFKYHLSCLKSFIEKQSLSPIVVQQLLGYCNYFKNIDFYRPEFNKESYENEVKLAKDFNQKFADYTIQIIKDTCWVPNNNPEIFIQNIIKKNPKYLSDPNLDAKKYKKIFSHKFTLNFYLFQIYEKVSELLELVQKQEYDLYRDKIETIVTFILNIINPNMIRSNFIIKEMVDNYDYKKWTDFYEAKTPLCVFKTNINNLSLLSEDILLSEDLNLLNYRVYYYPFGMCFFIVASDTETIWNGKNLPMIYCNENIFKIDDFTPENINSEGFITKTINIASE
ncbi:hypothetical protein DMUE_3201 [Dictyocoela muelleri]|nr:hypothetical protein DMUE_3201 [Dictyocoela muelleri]